MLNKIFFNACDGTQPGGNSACIDNGCNVHDCACFCRGSAPNFTSLGYTFLDCDGTVHGDSRACTGDCPTCPTPTKPKPAENCTWDTKSCVWICSFAPTCANPVNFGLYPTTGCPFNMTNAVPAAARVRPPASQATARTSTLTPAPVRAATPAPVRRYLLMSQATASQ